MHGPEISLAGKSVTSMKGRCLQLEVFIKSYLYISWGSYSLEFSLIF